MATDIKNDANLSGNLVSCWLTDESGLLTDLHGSNNLTNNNTVTLTTGEQGDAGDFEASSSQYLSHADNASLSITGDITIAAWIRLESATSNQSQCIVTKYADNVRAYAFQFRNSGGTHAIRGIFSSGGTSADLMTVNISTLSLATWYHVVVTYDVSAGDMEVFIDGSSEGTDTTGTMFSLADTTATFGIGVNEIDDTPTQFFDGRLNQVLLYSKVLNGTGITDLAGSIPYEAGAAGAAGNALAWCNF